MRTAFTLIELLVVVSIIALLAALMLPTLAVVKDGANTARCASNCRQLAIGILGYAADSGGLAPPPYWHPTSWSPSFRALTWDESISEYCGLVVDYDMTNPAGPPPGLVHMPILRCPHDRGPEYQGVQRRSYSYVAPFWWNGTQWRSDLDDVRMRSAFPMSAARGIGNPRLKQSQLIMIADMVHPLRLDVADINQSMGFGGGSVYRSGDFSPSSTPHRRRRNNAAVFFDGHTEVITMANSNEPRAAYTPYPGGP